MFLSQDDYNCVKDSFMSSRQFAADKYTFNQLPFNDILAAPLSPLLVGRINDGRSYKNRLCTWMDSETEYFVR